MRLQQRLQDPLHEDASEWRNGLLGSLNWGIGLCTHRAIHIEPGFGTWAEPARAWLLFAKGHESTEPDHAEAGGNSLVAAETRTGSQACAERGSKSDDEEVGTGVQRDRHGA